MIFNTWAPVRKRRTTKHEDNFFIPGLSVSVSNIFHVDDPLTTDDFLKPPGTQSVRGARDVNDVTSCSRLFWADFVGVALVSF